MTCASKPCSWTGETPQACRGGSRAARGKRSLARKSLALFRVHSKMFIFRHRFLSFVSIII
ncbi:hypothetical protein GA0061094_0663 [[Bacillus] enclensis]|uniref:Uncharacterized protein n=1 Tax=[Bacillus] enclensis TaxID=1402860 RepID=A0A1C3ZFF8_9BACI|nr:hypothetical protein [[Bacillus] enclensis]SCB81137.1 hypothetical protein GA0061094_0663 [[Bacillus] enclensis]